MTVRRVRWTTRDKEAELASLALLRRLCVSAWAAVDELETKVQREWRQIYEDEGLPQAGAKRRRRRGGKPEAVHSDGKGPSAQGEPSSETSTPTADETAQLRLMYEKVMRGETCDDDEVE